MIPKTIVYLALFFAVFCADIGAYTFGDFFDDLLQPGRRRGLIGRLDAGGGVSFIDVDYPLGNIDKEEGAFAMTGGFGYAFTDQFMLQFNIHWSIYASALDEDDDAFWFILLGPLGPFLIDKQMVLGVEAAYFVRPSIPSWFFEIGVGGGLINNPFDEHSLISDSHEGLGLSAGVGYEFSRHFCVEIKYLYTRAEENYTSGRQVWTCHSLQLVIGVIGY